MLFKLFERKALDLVLPYVSLGLIVGGGVCFLIMAFNWDSILLLIICDLSVELGFFAVENLFDGIFSFSITSKSPDNELNLRISPSAFISLICKNY